MKKKTKKVNHAKKSVPSNKMTRIDPLMMKKMTQMNQMQQEEQGETMPDQEAGEQMTPPPSAGGLPLGRRNYKGRNF